MNNKSQLNQDLILDEQIFKGKRNGIFVEVGALDGHGASNTFFFEKERNWSGLLIEPNPFEYDKIKNFDRNLSYTENCAISDIEQEITFLAIEGPCNVLSGIKEFYNPSHVERINRELNSYVNYPPGHEYFSRSEEFKMRSVMLQTLFDKYNFKEIDLVSIDVEGAEFQVLKSIDFNRVNISVFLIENNYGLQKETEFLITKGYRLFGSIQWDCVFVKNDLIL